MIILAASSSEADISTKINASNNMASCGMQAWQVFSEAKAHNSLRARAVLVEAGARNPSSVLVHNPHGFDFACELFFPLGGPRKPPRRKSSEKPG